MADTANITENLLEMYGRNDWMMRLNFRFFMKLSGLAELPRGERILDCGCAMGHLIMMLKREGFTDIIGIDAAKEMADAASKLTGGRIIHADVLDMDNHIETESFGAVIVSDLVHHLPSTSDWDRLLASCNRALKPGGMLLFREPWPNAAIKTLYAMSKVKAFHAGFLKARLKSFVEEDHLLQYFFGNWIPRYKGLISEHGFEMTKDFNWLVHRITVARKKVSFYRV